MKKQISVVVVQLVLGVGMVVGSAPALAQVWAIEGLPWQFETSADKANKAVVLDIMERKKGGYYDSFKANYYTTNNTYIRRQYNCGQNANATGSAADSAQESRVSSPSTRNQSGNYLDTTGNISDAGPQENTSLRAQLHDAGNIGAGASGSGSTVGAGTALIDTRQDNSGPIVSRVRSSPSNARSAPINASQGHNWQDMAISQSNTGTQVARVEGGTACDFSGGGAVLN